MVNINKLMFIPNDEKQKYPLCRLQLLDKRLDTQLNKPTNQIQYVSKVVKLTNKKSLLQNFGD